MKGKFDVYVLWPSAKSVQNWIADQSTARNFMVNGIKLHFFHKNFVLNSTVWSSNNVRTGNLPKTHQAMAVFHQFSVQKTKSAVFPVYWWIVTTVQRWKYHQFGLFHQNPLQPAGFRRVFRWVLRRSLMAGAWPHLSPKLFPPGRFSSKIFLPDKNSPRI